MSSLAGDDRRVIVGVHEDVLIPPGVLEGGCQSLVEVSALNDDLGPIDSDSLEPGFLRALRHENPRRRPAEQTRRIGQG